MDTLIVAVRVILSLAVVLGLLWYIQRRLSRGSRRAGIAQAVTIVGRHGVGQKASVVVVDVEGQRLVLGVTEQSVTVLSSATAPPAPESAEAAVEGANGSAFARVLRAVSTEPPTPVSLAPRESDVSAPPARLAGSILSPATWTQAVDALRHRR
ncbi:flagellar biosynthetic protein FliO [Cryobacterium sp. Hh7]|uniref:FliO/MopB family protein n=1 Tax=Cryobacterium sp. Hh7 TaxID=1259159 RepID=UPI00106C090A|nr:flagellar biosynthetic protein FliO [Cryobacterium sp. Hh7]TFD58581.1 flagellar biosynthetic protein FliO [Cryobacterium sp. Hh7]